MSAETLSLVASAVLSLLFSYVPGLNEWFGKLDGVHKRLIMLALLAIVAGGSYALACAGVGQDLGVAVTCDKSGAVELLKVFILAVMANQTIYTISPKS